MTPAEAAQDCLQYAHAMRALAPDTGYGRSPGVWLAWPPTATITEQEEASATTRLLQPEYDTWLEWSKQDGSYDWRKDTDATMPYSARMVYQCLLDHPCTQMEIARMAGIPRSTMRSGLYWLERREMVRVIETRKVCGHGHSPVYGLIEDTS